MIDCKSLFNLSHTNSYFHSTIIVEDDKALLKRALLRVEVESCAKAWSTSLANDEVPPTLPCYGCFKLLEKCHYTSMAWWSSTPPEGPRAFKRRCMTCNCSASHLFPQSSVVFVPVKYNGGLWVYCGGCKQVTHLSLSSQCTMNHNTDYAAMEVPTDFRCAFCPGKASVLSSQQ